MGRAGVAGFVVSAGNPFYLYETKLWTILHQLLAVALGPASRIVLSEILSGVLAMVTCGLAMVTFALSRSGDFDRRGCLVFVTRAASNAGYPICWRARRTPRIDRPVDVRARASAPRRQLLSNRRLSAWAHAVDPSFLGAWLWPIVGLAFVGTWVCSKARARAQMARDRRRSDGAQPLVQFAFIYHGPTVDSAVSTPFIRTFIAQWDGHRAVVDLGRPGVVLNEIALVLAVIWLTGFTDQTTERPGCCALS